MIHTYDAVIERLLDDLEQARPGDSIEPTVRLFDEVRSDLEPHLRNEAADEEIRRFLAIAAHHLHAERPTADGLRRAGEMLEGVRAILVGGTD